MIMKNIALKGILILILSIVLNVGLKADSSYLNQKQDVCSESFGNVKQNMKEGDSSESLEFDFLTCQYFNDIRPASPINITLIRSYITQIYPATCWLDDKSLHILEIL
ncbi:MAG: hypothetical protein ACLFNU_07525 [Bacteroidales bacterium]